MLQLESLVQSPTGDLGQIVTNLRNLQCEHFGSDRKENEEYVRKLFALASKIDEKDPDYDRKLFYIYSHISVLHPNALLIPQISLKTDFGPLFKTITTLYTFRRKFNTNKSIFKQAFLSARDNYNRSPSNFYSRNILSFMTNMPKLLADSEAQEYNIALCELFSSLQPTALTDTAMSLCKEIFFTLFQLKIPLYPNTVNSILEFFKNGHLYPGPTLFYFFNSWNLLCSQKRIPQSEQQDQFDYFTSLLEKGMLTSGIDVFKLFHWNICFKYFGGLMAEKHQTRILSFINYKIRTLKRPDGLSPKSIQNDVFHNFLNKLTDNYKRKVSWMLLTFTQQLILTFSSHAKRMKRIKCVKVSSLFSEVVTKQKLTFKEQTRDKQDADKINKQLFSIIDIRISNNKDSIKKDFDLFEEVIKSIRILILYYADVFTIFMKLMQADEFSVPEFYLIQLIQEWFHFMIESTFRLTHLQQFLYNQFQTSEESLSPYYRKISDLSALQIKFQTYFKEIPPRYLNLIANVIMPVLIKSTRKHRISYFFIICFNKLTKDSPNFVRILLMRMHQYFMENLALLTSDKEEDAIFMNQWMMLMIKLKGIDPYLALLFRDSQRQVVNILCNGGRQIIHQSIVIDTIKTYVNFMLDGLTKEQIKTEQAPYHHRIRKGVIEDFYPSVQVDVSSFFINQTFDLTKTNFMTVAPILSLAVKSDEYKTRGRAVEMIIGFMEKEPSYDQYTELLHNFFNALKNESNIDLSKRIFRQIPKFARYFVTFSKYKIIFDSHTFSKNEILTLDFLIAVENNLKHNAFEAFNLYGLLLYVYTNSSFENISKEVLMKFLSLLTYLYRYENLRQLVNSLYVQIRDYFAEKDPVFFFLCLVFMSNISRSRNSEYVLQIIEDFVGIVDVDRLKPASDQIFAFVPILNNTISMIVGLTVLLKKSSELVLLNHIKSLIKLVTPDMKIPPLLNSILKLYLGNVSMEIKRDFLIFGFSNLGEIVDIYRPIIIKRIRKLGIQMNSDLAKFSTDTEVAPYQIAICLLCGFPQAINYPSNIEAIQKAFKQPSKDAKFADYIRSLIFTYAIFKAQCKTFIQNQSPLFKFMLHIIMGTIRYSQPIRAYSKKALLYLQRYTKEDEKVANIIEQWWSYIQKFQNTLLAPSDFTKFTFYHVMSKTMPEKINPHHFHILFEKVHEFSEMNELKQMESMQNFILVMKQLSLVTDKTIILNNLQVFLSSYGKLFHCQELAFKNLTYKYLLRILLRVPVETVSTLISINREMIEGAHLLLELIGKDTEIQKQIFVEITHVDYSRIHPQAYKMLPMIVKNLNDNRSDYLQNLFSSMLRNYEDGIKHFDNEYIILYSTAKALFVDTIKSPSFKAVQLSARIFLNADFVESKLYSKFKEMMKSLPKEFINGLLFYILSMDRSDPVIVEILLKQTIKCIIPISSSDNESLWNYLLSKLSDKDYILAVFSCIYILAKSDNIVRLLLKNLIMYFETLLTNQDVRYNLIAYKLSAVLIEKNLLPSSVHQKICEHLLAFPKFFDIPFSKYTSIIFSKVEKPFSKELIDSLISFVSEKIISPHRDFMKLPFIVSHFPNIEEILPFEIIPSILHILEGMSSPDFNILSNEMFYIIILRCIPYLKVRDETMAHFSKLSYNFINSALIKPGDVKAFPEQFFQFMLQKDHLYTPFPDELINNIGKFLPSSYLFGFVCFVVKFAPFSLVERCRDYIYNALQINNEQITFFLKFFVPGALKTKAMCKLFLPEIEKVIDQVKNNSDNLVATVVSYAPISMRLQLLDKYYIEKKQLSPKSYFLAAKDISPQHQEDFLRNAIRNNDFFTYFHHLIGSSKVSNSAKILLLKDMIKHADKYSYKYSLAVIEILKRDKIPDADKYILMLSIVISNIVDQHLRIILFDTCQKIIGMNSEIDRFIMLVETLKISLWNDKFLPFILFICMGETNKSLIAFSNVLSECTFYSQSFFNRIVENEKCPNLYNFYIKCLKHQNLHVVNNLTVAFQNMKIQMPDELNWKTLKSGILTDVDLSTFNNERILYPNRFSDYTFGKLLNDLQIDEVSLILNFLLGNFSNFPINSFSFPLIEKIYNNSVALRSQIERDIAEYSLFYRHNKLDDFKDPKIIELINLKTFQIKGAFTRFELERIVTLESLVLLQDNNQALKNLTIDNAVNSYFYSLIEKNEKKNLNPPIVNRSDDYMYLVLPPGLSHIFKNVSGYTKHGFIIATIRDIEIALNKGSNSPLAWASLMYHLFMNTPSAKMANNAINLLFDAIENAPSSQQKYEAATRIITILRICSIDTQTMSVVTEAVHKFTPSSAHYLKIWTSQLLHIAKNDEIRNQKREMIYDNSSMFTRLSLESPESIRRELNKYIPENTAQKTFNVLIAFHEFLTDLFDGNQVDLPKINSMTPIIFPNRIFGGVTVCILRIHDDIKKLSNDRYLISATTHFFQRNQFIVERVRKSNEVTSFSIALHLLNMSLKNSYAASYRNLNFMSRSAFEIGREFVIYPTQNELQPIEEFSHHLCKYSTEQYFLKRQLLIRSLISNQFLRHLFCLPHSETYLYSQDSYKVPVLMGDFHVHPLNSSEALDFDTRSENLKEVLGPTLEGEVMVSTAALAKGLVENVEMLRSVLEVLAFDSVDIPSTDSIKDVSYTIEERLIRFAAPDPKHARKEDFLEWTNELMCYVGKAERSEVIQMNNLSRNDSMNLSMNSNSLYSNSFSSGMNSNFGLGMDSSFNENLSDNINSNMNGNLGSNMGGNINTVIPQINIFGQSQPIASSYMDMQQQQSTFQLTPPVQPQIQTQQQQDDDMLQWF
ncbi:hypothetical protein TRFO_29296 [Tritrichomonas foetus]|uniref:Uncharacterized protein n=1 Tax=Tritrichomonas foetus TaxID=1144522 RepID=A0A1J4JXY8_9EUKA|nr:hypothetical protein TRFO_29296 [Tritrichomonas foetus]|eukprot:OHT03320.1 hypothetical protein TRFO_29296 [Tritrichomonas foetus]